MGGGRNIRRNGGWMSRLLNGHLRRNARERKWMNGRALNGEGERQNGTLRWGERGTLERGGHWREGGDIEVGREGDIELGRGISTYCTSADGVP